MSLETRISTQRTGLLYTNRYNLMAYLRADLVTPQSLTDRYQADWGDKTPDHLQLWLRPMGAYSQAPGRDDIFPVAIELTLPEGDAELPVLHRSGEVQHKRVSTLNPSEDLAVFVPGPLPREAIRRLVFRSEDERFEHEAREYGDMRPFTGEVSVDASVFQPHEVPDLMALADLKGPAGLSACYRWYDRTLGALTLLLWLREHVPQALFPRCLSALAFAPAVHQPGMAEGSQRFVQELSKFLPPGSVLREATWLHLLPYLAWKLAGLGRGALPAPLGTIVAECDEVGLRRRTPDDIRETAEFVLLLSCLSALFHDELGQASRSARLELIQREFESTLPRIGPKSARATAVSANIERVLEEYRAMFGILQDVVRGRQSIELLLDSDSPAASATMTALLLFSGRPEPAACATWLQDPLLKNRSPEAGRRIKVQEVATALMLSGFAVGYRHLPVSMRPQGAMAELHRDLAARLWHAATGNGDEAWVPVLQPEEPWERRVEGSVRRRRKVTVLPGQDLWLQFDDTLADLRAMPDDAWDIAADLARHWEWEDCYDYVYNLAGMDFELVSRGRKKELKIKRRLEPELRLDMARLQKRLKQSGQELPFEVRLKLAITMPDRLPPNQAVATGEVEPST